MRNSASEAIRYFIKAASYNTIVKTSPQTYVYLAEAYEQGPYAKLSAAYERGDSGRIETGELALENIYQIVDRRIDAYARAVALAGFEPPKIKQANGLRIRTGRGSTEWMAELTELLQIPSQ